MSNQFKTAFFTALAVSIIGGSIFGGITGFLVVTRAGSNSTLGRAIQLFSQNGEKDLMDSQNVNQVVKLEEESAVITAVEKNSPTVVSIIISKDLPIIERYYSEPDNNGFFKDFFGNDFGDFFGFQTPKYRQNGTEKREVGGGTGFLVSADGYIITNRHVVNDTEAEYTVLMNDENKYEAKVLARDPVNDLAIIKIEGNDFPFVELGSSDDLKVGQSVIAIGNSLGEFRNTVSTGVISGLSRSVTAGSFNQSEQLLGVIQTDASINPGNSGGPLLNLAGQVIGINTAIAANAENIGFAIPVNEVKNIYESVKKNGKFVRPWLGVRYVQINKEIAEANKLDVEYGALIVRGDNRTDLAVLPGSPADKAGLVENDIILEIDSKKINDDNPLAHVISRYQPGDEIKLKILHKGEEKDIKITLEEMKEAQ